jgi:anti-sigma regulatory factor (Ser/Thr protein kinase)
VEGWTLPVAPEASARARRVLEKTAGPVAPAVLDDLRVVISELVANAVKHTGPQSDQIELRITRLRTCIRIEVTDHGPGFYPSVPPPPSDRDSGWGLYLVDKLTARWGVEYNGATRVWAEVPLLQPKTA